MTVSLGIHVSQAVATAASATTAARVLTGGATTAVAILVSWFNGAGAPAAPTSVTDSAGNTYSQVGATLTSHLDANFKSALFAKVNLTGGSATFNATFAGTQDVISMWVAEGIATASPISQDQAPAGKDTAASPYTSNSATTTSAVELLLTYVATGTVSGTEAITWDNSFVSTGDDITDANSFITGSVASRAVSATGTYNSQFTATGAGTNGAMTWLITFKEAGTTQQAPSLFFGSGTTG